MKKFKKILAVLLSVVMIVCMFSVPVSAASVFDKAVKLSPMELVSGNFKNCSAYFYKITLPDSGKISFYCSDYDFSPVTLLDTSGNTVIKGSDLYYMVNKKYEVSKKGTYYIRIEKKSANYVADASYFNDFYYGFEPDHTPTISLALNVKVGDELDFSALGSNYTGKCRKVNVVGAGKAKIRVYMDNNEYAEITLIATKK